MNVGYYFHPTAVFGPNGTAKTEAHWALFIRALAKEGGQVTYYAHSGDGHGVATMELGPEYNIRCVDLGPPKVRPLMFFWPRSVLKNFKPKEDGLDAMIVRGPTALLPAYAKRCDRAGIPMLGLLVDDTTNWMGKTGMPGWRQRLVKAFLRIQERAHARAGRDHLMMAIAKSIVRDPNYRRTTIVRTTSLSKADLTGPAGRMRQWPAEGDRIRLLFTGRFALEKGMWELCEAFEGLVRDGYNVELEFVGQTYGDKTLDEVVSRLQAGGHGDRLILTGFLEAGPALLAAYDRADVFVLPTFGEGSVTRTIKEAFARGVPVVTTTIREITEFLTDGEEAVLVPMGDAAALQAGIERVIKDPALRAHMTAKGFDFVQDYTNEASAALVIGHVRDEIGRLT